MYQSVSDGSHFVASEMKQDNIQAADVITSSVDLLFLHLIDQVTQLLQTNKFELLQQCEALKLVMFITFPFL